MEMKETSRTQTKSHGQDHLKWSEDLLLSLVIITSQFLMVSIRQGLVIAGSLLQQQLLQKMHQG